MNTDDKNADNDVKRVLRYLSGKLGDPERRAFDEQLAEDKDLRELLSDLRFATTGAAILDKIESNHISTELLLIYSENPQSLDQKNKTTIKNHLKTCKHCREDLEFCRHDSIAGLERKATGFWKGLFSAASCMFKPRLVLRPVYGLALILAIVIPAVIFYPGGEYEKDYISSFTIQSGTRDIGTVNDILISPADRFIELSFTIPVMKNRSYIINLFNGDSLPVLTRYEHNPDELFKLDIPVEYLSAGNNYLVVSEFESNIEQEKFDFIFDVGYSK